jgi:hypothetical protein
MEKNTKKLIDLCKKWNDEKTQPNVQQALALINANAYPDRRFQIKREGKTIDTTFLHFLHNTQIQIQ